MLLISQELTIGSQTQFMSKVLRPSKEELDWIHSLRYDQMREAPKQPLGWTGAPIDALPVVQSIQRTLEENCDAMMFMYNLTVSLLNEKKRRAHLGRVEEATIDLTVISSEVRQQAEQGRAYATFFLEQSTQWENHRTIKKPGAKDKVISGFVGYWSFLYRKPLYEYAATKARKAPVLMSRCNVLRLATSGYAEPWFFDQVPGEGRVELDAADLEAPSEAPYVDYDKPKSRATQVVEQVGSALTLQSLEVLADLEQTLTAPSSSAAPTSFSRVRRPTGGTSSASSASAGPRTTGS